MFKYLTIIWKNEYYKGGLILTATSFIGNFINYIFNILVGRSLGPVGYGEIVTLFSYLSITSIPIAILSTIIIRKIGESSSNEIAVTRSVEMFVLERIKKWFILIILIFFITPFIPSLTNLSPVSAYSLIPLLILSFLSLFYNAALQGLRMFLILAVISLIAGLLKLTGSLLVTIGIDGVNTIVFFALLSGIVSSIISIIIIRRKIKTQSNDKKVLIINQRLLNILRSRPFIITALATVGLTIFSNIDIIFVKKFFSSESAGIYSSWSLFAKIILYVLGPINGVSFVFFANRNRLKDQHKTLIYTFIFLIFVALLSYIFYNFFALYVVHFFFGNKFDAVIPILGSASFFGFFYTSIIILNNFFLAKKSRYSLILPLSLPFYIVPLFLFIRDLNSVIVLNILFSAIVFVICFLAYMKEKNNEGK